MPSLGSGGAEKSLVNLLNLIDYEKYAVDLLLFKREGLFLSQIPKEVRLLQPTDSLQYAYKIDRGIFSSVSGVKAGILRGTSTFICKCLYKETVRQQRWIKFYKRYLPNLEGEYDIAIGFLEGDASYYAIDKVNAKKKIIWIHNDFNEIKKYEDAKIYEKYFQKADSVVSISDKCVQILKQNYPAFVSYVAYTDSDGKTGEINITSETASKAPKPAIEKKTKTIEWGRQVDFSLKDFGKWDKIYYTTDGSVPDYNSEIYNYDTFSIPAVCRDLKVPEGVSSFTVKAVTAAFGKTDSDTVTYKYKVVPPAVKGIKATAGRTVKISWKKLNGADGYYIYRADKKTGSYKKIGSVKNVKTTVYKDKNARKGKTCYYKVKAYKGKNIGSFSKPAKAGIK